MLGWDILALPVLLWIDFDKGRKECGRGGDLVKGPAPTATTTADAAQA